MGNSQSKKQTSIILRAIAIYVFSFFLAIIFSPLFKLFYNKIFSPSTGGGLFVIGGRDFELFLGGIVLGFFFFVVLIGTLFTKERSYIISIVGVIIGLFIFWVTNIKFIIWYLIFAIAGLLLGQVILLIKARVKKKAL